MNLRRRALATAIGAAISGLSIGDVGCGSTGSKRFAFEARAGGIERDSAEPYTFTNPKGWEVTLTRADVTIGPVYVNVLAPLRQAAMLLRLLPEARADDLHLGEGRVVGEVLGQVSFDALSPALVPFGATGTITEEQVRTADIWFWPPPGTAAETTNIDAPSVDLAGEAARGAERVRFRGTLIFDEAWASDAQPGERSALPMTEIRKVRGVPASFFPTEGGALEIRVDVRALFRGADFTSLAASPEDEDGTKILVQSKRGKLTTDQVMRNVFQGLRSSSGTYAVRWVPLPKER
ncbi:MAG: hypothetical protein KIT84_41030 [Labilithrix sp.]|nr:hypothetical protein [Labilithrix sp.]MCW5817455.1 hypothetical protein [Labilithrix sp.]